MAAPEIAVKATDVHQRQFAAMTAVLALPVDNGWDNYRVVHCRLSGGGFTGVVLCAGRINGAIVLRVSLLLGIYGHPAKP